MTVILLIATLPLIIALIASIIFSSSRMRKIQAQDEQVYYEMLYTISTDLINADRDLYQAMLAGTQFQAYHDYITPEQLAGYKDSYESNAKQAIDGVNTAATIAKQNATLYSTLKDDDGDTFQTMSSNFEKQFNTWLSTYDFNTGEGDIEQFSIQFEATRDYISNMSDIVEVWAVQEKNLNEKQINLFQSDFARERDP